jgi:hypothetical protein
MERCRNDRNRRNSPLSTPPVPEHRAPDGLRAWRPLSGDDGMGVDRKAASVICYVFAKR